MEELHRENWDTPGILHTPGRTKTIRKIMAITHNDDMYLGSAKISHFKKSNFMQLFPALLIFSILANDFYSYKVSPPTSPYGTQHSEEKKQVKVYGTKNLLQIGEWVQVSDAIYPYEMKACNFSFHSWSKYASKNMRNRSLGVQSWVWRNFLDEYASNANIFHVYASRFLNSFGKNRTMLMIGFVNLLLS